MNVFLVRLKDTKDLVGIFASDSIEAVVDMVDESTDPADCEYQEMGAGGIMWSEPAVAIPVPLGEEGDEFKSPIPWSGASLTEFWWRNLHGGNDDDWIPFFEEDERKAHANLQSAAPSEPAQIIPFDKGKR